MTASTLEAPATTEAQAGDRDWLRAELKEANRRLAESERFRAAFLARVSHELRTPLHAILGFGELLASGVATAPEAPVEYGREIHAAGLDLLSLIDDLLEAARAEGDDLKLDLREVLASDLLGDVLVRLRPLAAAKDISLSVAISSRLPPMTADPERLKQVLWQLANNAVKFTPRSGRVTLRVLRAGSAVRFDVEDTGQGIDAERLKRIFDGHGPDENPLNRSAGGAGLGLSLARRLVAIHGGRIAAASAPGAGSRFWFTIPAMPPDATPPAGGPHER